MWLPPLPPTARDTPAHVARALAAVDPAVTLVYCSRDLWWMIRYSPNAERRRSGEAMLAGEMAKPPALIDWAICRQARFMIDGWSLIGDYTFRGEPPTQFLVNELHIKLSRSDKWYDQKFKELEADASGQGEEQLRKASIQDYLQAEGRALFRSRVRGRPMVTRT